MAIMVAAVVVVVDIIIAAFLWPPPRPIKAVLAWHQLGRDGHQYNTVWYVSIPSLGLVPFETLPCLLKHADFI